MLKLSPETAVAATIDLLKTVGCTGELDCGCRLCCAWYQAEYERTPDVLKRAMKLPPDVSRVPKDGLSTTDHSLGGAEHG